jgi:DNA-binding PadR family transcriptional regulator
MGPVDTLGEFEALVLAAVIHAGADANGTGVYNAIEARSNRDVSLPAIHVTLRRLEEKALLTSEVGSTSERGGRPRRFYRATPRGARALHEFRDMWRNVWRGLRIPGQETR